MNVRWYLNRLACMSIAEIVFRLRRLFEAEYMRARGPRRVPAMIANASGRLGSLAEVAVDPAPYRALAEAAIGGRQRCLSIEDAPFGPDFGWTRDPRTGTVAPLEFGRKLNYRNERLVGDIKYLWEPNRHLHIVTLAQAYRLTGEMRYVDNLFAHIESWIEQNPYPLGPNWSSSLEAGIRLINWSIAWRLLGGDPGVELLAADRESLLDAWLESVYRHLEFVTGYYSGYSSANNHLIGEAAGVYIGCLSWPRWPVCDRWAARARTILIAECERQISPDGVDREQATSYQAFVLEFLLLAGAAAADAGEPMPGAYWERLERMAEFLAALLDDDGSVPQIGDADDALVVQLAPDAHETVFSSLVFAVGAGRNRADLIAAAGPAADRARWLCCLLGAPDRGEVPVGRPAPAMLRSFSDGGYHLLHVGDGDAGSMHAILDTGPLGYLGIAAHGHADALSILLWVDGLEFLVDAGTYAYHTEAKWRTYFRGTRAHNTVCVDGLDQSEPGGNFMWTRHANARCLQAAQTPSGVVVEGSHDGYMRLRDALTHTRRLEVDHSARQLIVSDRFDCRGRHEVEIWWHFSEACSVSTDNLGARIARDHVVLDFRADAAEYRIVGRFGSEEPPGGWISRRFGVKEPIHSLAWVATIDGGSTIRTTIDVQRDARSQDY